MAEILKRRKALSVNPLKASQTIGAALAFLGFNRAMPMLHGSQGCTAFGKVFFVRHFREPIPLQTTAMDQVAAVMGSEDLVVEGLRTICSKNNPSLVGVPTTGLAETQGSDVNMAVGQFRKKYPEFDHIPVVALSAPDFSGCLESGFAAATKAIIEALVPERQASGTQPGRRKKQLNVLVNASLTPGDLEELKDTIEQFGLRPVLVPDLSDSLDGHLSDTDFSPLTVGGTSVDEENMANEAGAELLIGNSHALETAHRLQLPLLRAGFPQYDQLGGYQRTWIGYRGTRQTLFELANMMLELEKGEIEPYRSLYAQKPDYHEASDGAATTFESSATPH
jgi:nitrogenase molybdenum-iron protein NifN